MTLEVHAGDRVRARDRAWVVRKAESIAEGHGSLELEALDGERPERLSILTPPDEVEPLPPERPSLDPGAFDSFASWSRAHRILAAGAVREIGMLSGARFGRVALEAYQVAPALRLLAKPRPSLLVADDVGLGKTIEAGIALLELMARGRADRVLVVAPPGLLLQWEEELREKFGLRFTVIANAASLTAVQSALPAGVNPWDALPRVLTSIDYLKKQTVRARALRRSWDVVVVDEAHALAEGGTATASYLTQRTRLGHDLREKARGLILLTATPHNGHAHSFRSLLELVEPSLATFHGAPADVVRRVESARIRRMKDQITRGPSRERVFPLRHVEAIAVRDLTPSEVELLRKVGTYCSRTARAAEGEEYQGLVSFAMQIVKKRALSSRRALAETIRHRLDALRREDAREEPPERAEIRELQMGLPLGEKAADRVAQRVVRSSVPLDEKRRNSEKRALSAIQRLLRDLPDRDPKIDALVRYIRTLSEGPEPEKVIVFTEYRDTLEALRERLEREPELAGRCVVLTGGLSPRQRRERQRQFELAETRVLLATDAASEGLNLQKTCRRVVHVELPWNPNRLEQRNGRVDRYGQVREPEIRWLYYPQSPEDDVLSILVGKIEEMKSDRISTPDVLGVFAGEGEIEGELTALDPEADDIESRKRRLVTRFEDRTADFVRNVQPLVAAGGMGLADVEEAQRKLDSADPLLGDDEHFESLVLSLLGPGAMREISAGVYRIVPPASARGPGVAELYPSATLRRSVAVGRTSDEVEFITPIHPLARALGREARRRLLQVFPDRRGLAPRRLAARVVPSDEPASAVFTWFGAVTGGGALLEEHVVAVRVGLDGRVLEESPAALRWLREDGPVGSVAHHEALRVFAPSFPASAAAAASAAEAWLTDRVTALRRLRREQGTTLRAEADRGLADRLAEIEEEERKARGLVEPGTGQGRLFPVEDEVRVSFDVRRAAARRFAEARKEEISEFERVDDARAPSAMGFLLLVPGVRGS